MSNETPPADVPPGVSDRLETSVEAPAALFPVAALCASAGGLSAFTTILGAVPPNSGIAFIVVQHLDPTHPSQLVEILQRATAMPVVVIEDGMPLVPDRVHVIPHDGDLGMRGEGFTVGPRRGSGVRNSIDRLLRSLSGNLHGRAIGVVLSGTGSDGALGIQAIREEGGVTLAQDPDDAAFDSMPRAAIVTGCVDVVAPAARLAEEIARVARAVTGHAPGVADDVEQDRDLAMAEILEVLRRATAIDFGEYRQSTIRRRLLRRLSLRRAANTDDYLRQLVADPGEVQALVQDLLIHVTRFFRDRDVFSTLAESVFPDLIRRTAATGVVRIWVPGCSTGEEAYSLAIGFAEAADQMGSPAQCHIFATDVNDAVLDRARRGLYVENISEDITPQRLSRFFERTATSWRVTARIRDACIFSRHDLLRDPPLSRMHLVSCRNVLIYIERHQSILERLHFALETRGYLLLGRSETTIARPDLFSPVERDARLYRPSDTVSRSMPMSSSARRDMSPPAGSMGLAAADAASAYEELVAANEELQSLNEELESAKEETEATNQELRTLNQELESRNLALRAAQQFTQATLDTVRSPLVVVDSDLQVLLVNRAFQHMFQVSPDAIEGQALFALGPAPFESGGLRALLERARTDGRPLDDIEIECVLPNSGRRTLVVNVRRFEPGARLLLGFEDVTVLRQLEADRSQAQKMEAIGHLAAGVAHDFNNLLTTVIANADLAVKCLPGDSPIHPHLADILGAGRQAADLTRQLLAYAGRAKFTLERVALGDVVRQTVGLLHVTIPSQVQVRLELERDLPLLLADPSQIHQVVSNLVSNAVEAIGQAPGAVLVRTGRLLVGLDAPRGPGDAWPPVSGDHLLLEVTDSGVGMSDEVQRQIFDPFFTTKFTGRGLGLAAVMGIVRAHKGRVEVHSVVGRGTTMRVLLPTGEAGRAADDVPATDAPPRGSGTILAVDDEAGVLRLLQRGLGWLGYTVIGAPGGPEAVAALEARPDVALVLLDATMPGMNGLDTLHALRRVNPGVRVLVCSGLGDRGAESLFANHSVNGFLHKPFTVNDAARAIAACLSARP